MSRKHSRPQPDGDGRLSTGIYRRYVGPRKRNDPDAIEFKLDEWASRINRPATTDLDRIRHGLWEYVRPWLDGPLNTEACRQQGVTVRVLDDGHGPRPYRSKPMLDRQEQWLQDAIRDAFNALNEIRVIRHNLRPGGNLDLVFRAAYQLGRLCERIGIRPFEPLVAAEKGRLAGARKAAAITNEAHAELRPQYQAEVDQLMAAGSKYSPACESVASKLGVSARTVERHTTNPQSRTRN